MHHDNAGSKRICDYAIETMRLHRDEEWYNTILAHYIAIASGQSQEVIGFITFSGDLRKQIDALSIENAEVLFELFPYGTEDVLYTTVYSTNCSLCFAETLEPKDFYPIHSNIKKGRICIVLWHTMRYTSKRRN